MKAIFNQLPIHYSDLTVLARLITTEPVEIFIFDPSGKMIWDEDQTLETSETRKKILFNLGKELIRYKQYELDEFDFIIDFSDKIQLKNYYSEALNLIQSPTGRARYLFQKNDRSYKVLDFLPGLTLRSRTIKFVVKTIIRLNKIKWIGKSLNILSKEELNYQEVLKDQTFDSYAIFLGTPGFWRKPVIQLIKNNEATHYIKYPISPQTESLVIKEKSNIKRITALNLNLLKLPQLVNSDTNTLIQKALNSGVKKQLVTFSEKHFLALKNLSLCSIKSEKVRSTPFYYEIMTSLHYLKNNVTPENQQLFYKLEAIKSALPLKKQLNTSVAHGDFTPWNVLIEESQVKAYDWEMALFGAPLLYDIFHFVYQSELLVRRNGIREINEELDRIFSLEEVGDFVQRFKIDVALNHQLYLLHNISKNLMLIQQQPTISNDQEILITNWKTALSRLNITTQTEELRKPFLADLQQFLSDKRYATLKFFLPDFTAIPVQSDLDLAIDKKELKAVNEFITNHPFVRHNRDKQKSFMQTTSIHLMDNSYLSIDFIHDFIRKGERYLDLNKVLDEAVEVNNVKHNSLFNDIAYSQHFYTLNKSSIPLKYQLIFISKLSTVSDKTKYLDQINAQYETNYQTLIDAFAYSNHKRKSIKKFIHKTYLKSSEKLTKKITYMKDLTVDLRKNKGFVVTFSGVDGAGKTTIISAVKAQFEQKYRREIVLLRHRPGILPILSAIKHGGREKAEQHAGSQLPRQGKNKNKISSLLRFSYYFLDYLIGQVYVYFKYVLRGKIVIYDRYYFDFINDGKRSNIQLKSKFLKRLYTFIYKPKYNFYLYNEPNVILKRKQELSAQDITSLNAKYTLLFDELSIQQKGTYKRIKNDSKEETIASIFETIHKVA